MGTKKALFTKGADIYKYLCCSRPCIGSSAYVILLNLQTLCRAKLNLGISGSKDHILSINTMLLLQRKKNMSIKILQRKRIMISPEYFIRFTLAYSPFSYPPPPPSPPPPVFQIFSSRLYFYGSFLVLPVRLITPLMSITHYIRL